MYYPIKNTEVRRLSSIVIALVALLSAALASAQMLRLPVGEYDQEIQGHRLFTDDGKPFAPLPICTSIEEVLPNRLIVKSLNLFGVINLSGKVIIPFMYDDINLRSETAFFVKQRNKWALMSVNGEQLTDFRYDEPFYYSRRGFVKENGKYGIIDSIGKEILPPQFTDLEWPYSNLQDAYWVSLKKPEGIRWGRVSKDGTILLPFIYDSVKPYTIYDGIEYFAAQREGKWGIEVTREGSTVANVVVPHQFNAIGSFGYTDHHIFIDLQQMPAEGGKWGLVKILLPSSTTNIIEHTTSFAAPFLYDDSFQIIYGNKDFTTKKGNRWGMVDIAGKQLLPFLYDTPKIISVAPNFYLATLRGKTVIVDSSGRNIVPREEMYDDVSWEDLYYNEFYRQMSQVPSDAPTAVIVTKRKGLSGFLSTSGTVLLEPIAQRLEVLPHGVLYFRKANSSFGAYLNSEGKILTDSIYDDPPIRGVGYREYMRVTGPNGLTVVKRGGKNGVIDKTGKEILPLEYETIAFLWDTGIIMARRPTDKGGKWSCFSGTGQAIFTDKYDSVDVEKGYSDIGSQALVRNNGKWGMVSLSTGEELIPPTYDSVAIVPRRISNSVAIQGWRGNKVCLFSTITHREISPYYDQMDYNWAFHYQPDFMRIRRGDKWGFISMDSLNAGQELVSPRYDYAYHDVIQAKIGRTTNAYTRVRMGTKYGYVALKGADAGKEVVPPSYDIAAPANENGQVVVLKGGVEARLQLPVVKDAGGKNP